MRRYDADEVPPRRPGRMQPPGSYPGVPGYVGNTISGKRGYGADYLSAWGPGGWSREHGREHHGQPRFPRGQYDRGYRGDPRDQRTWWYDDGAPTG
jgi:hypothetical protein